MRYVPRLAKVVNVLAVRQVKLGGNPKILTSADVNHFYIPKFLSQRCTYDINENFQ